MSGDITIRAATAADEPGWMALWRGYLEFYQMDLGDEVTRNTFRRIVDPAVAHMGSLLAETAEGRQVGLLNYVLHDITWTLTPVCYLEDLFVAEDLRGHGIGGALIEHLAAMGKEAGWHRIYWNTARDNISAQKLYNRLAERTGWVRYDMDLA